MDKYKDLSLEQIVALATEKRTEFNSLIALESPSTEQCDKAEALAAEIAEIEAAQESKQAEADQPTPAERMAALRTEAAAAVEGEDEGAEDEDAEENSDEEDSEDAEESADEADEQVEVEQVEKVEVNAAVKKPVKARASGVATLAKTTKRPAPPAVKSGNGPVSLVAAADTGFATGQALDGLLDVARAAINRAQGFPEAPNGDGGPADLRKFATAAIKIDYPDDLIVDEQDSLQRIGEVMDYATDEKRLVSASGQGSLTAAGGWCAPSETVYDLDDDATTEGMLSLPEVGVRRGGMRWPISPTFADFYANPGFIQTETEAIAGTTKPCVTIDCPSFDEERLDAEGICIKVPILTNAGYPEYVKTFVSGTLTAHQHWINANVIGRLVTASGAARVITGLGAVVGDSLEGLSLLADQTRQKYRLSMQASLEVVVPFWLKNVFKNDIERRGDFDAGPVTDQQLNAFFAARKLAVQFVYDWQALDETAEVYPATYNALMYPAGTFVKGTAPVINLSTVYDAASLAGNVYTGLFVEQGLLVAHKKFHSDLVTLPICSAGRMGARDLTCA